MTLFDYAVLIDRRSLSVLLSVIRGFVREVLALAAGSIAFVAASLSAAVRGRAWLAGGDSERVAARAGGIRRGVPRDADRA